MTAAGCAWGLAGLLVAALLPATAHAQARTCNTAGRTIELILDASGSMNARLPNGETRIAVAQRAIKGVASQVPAEAQLSLRIYGAQSPASDKNCRDTVLAVPFAPSGANAGPIAAAVDGVKARGYTPIAYALEQAANDFAADARERVIVLVSDGKETCQGDPAVAAKALAAKNITVHTVGFIVDTAARMQLQSIARITGGTYFDAPVGPELPETLKAALNACKQVVKAPARPQPGKLRTTSATWLAGHAVLNAETGQKVGAFDSTRLELALPAGIYEVQFGKGRWKAIEVRSGETTVISPGNIKVDNIQGLAGVVLLDAETGEEHGNVNRIAPQATVMPGLYTLRLTGGSYWPYVKIDGGRTTTVALAYVSLGDGLKWQKARIVTRDGNVVARFDAVTNAISVFPGDYVVEVDDRKIPFDAQEGQHLEIKP
jgi:hypothetical protein